MVTQRSLKAFISEFESQLLRQSRSLQGFVAALTLNLPVVKEPVEYRYRKSLLKTFGARKSRNGFKAIT